VIHELVLRYRLRNEALGPCQSKTPRDHLGEPIERSKRQKSAAPEAARSSAQLKEVIMARRVRADFFGSHLFHDPAWDILLRAYVALLDEERLSISALLPTSIVPATTTLRWVKALKQDGWLECSDDPLEDTLSLLELSTAGRAGMESYLAAVWPSLPL
jgi:hypothetical protein